MNASVAWTSSKILGNVALTLRITSWTDAWWSSRRTDSNSRVLYILEVRSGDCLLRSPVKHVFRIEIFFLLFMLAIVNIEVFRAFENW